MFTNYSVMFFFSGSQNSMDDVRSQTNQHRLQESETKNKRSAANRTRTCDMLVNSQPLYQLSYGGNQTRCERISHVSCLNRCATHRIKDYDLEMVLS